MGYPEKNTKRNKSIRIVRLKKEIRKKILQNEVKRAEEESGKIEGKTIQSTEL